MTERNERDRTGDRSSLLDARILDILQLDGRRTYAEIGAEVGISGPSAHERIKKLEARGVITGYGARVSPGSVGYGVVAFTWITMAPGTSGADLTARFAAIPEIEECHHIAGQADYIVKMRARDNRDLERLVRLVQTTEHVFTTETDVVFSTAFEGRPLHVARETDGSVEA